LLRQLCKFMHAWKKGALKSLFQSNFEHQKSVFL
jgi:hypothetical protein